MYFYFLFILLFLFIYVIIFIYLYYNFFSFIYVCGVQCPTCHGKYTGKAEDEESDWLHEGEVQHLFEHWHQRETAGLTWAGILGLLRDVRVRPARQGSDGVSTQGGASWPRMVRNAKTADDIPVPWNIFNRDHIRPISAENNPCWLYRYLTSMHCYFVRNI